MRRDAGTAGGSFAFVLKELDDFEAGCNETERTAGDTTCGFSEGAGELSKQLTVRAAWGGTETGCPSAAGPSDLSLADAEDGFVVAPDTLSSVDAVCVVLALELPTEADNVVQSDRVHFEIRLGVLDARSAGRPTVTVTRAQDTLASREEGSGEARRSGGSVSLQAGTTFTNDNSAAVPDALPFQDDGGSAGDATRSGDSGSAHATKTFTKDNTAPVLSALLAILAVLGALVVSWRRWVRTPTAPE